MAGCRELQEPCASLSMGDSASAISCIKSWLYHPAFPDHWECRSLYSLAEWASGVAFEEKMARLTTTLEELFAESAWLEVWIEGKLERPGL